MILQKYLLDYLNITFIFDRCHRSWAVVTPVKYECDIQQVTSVLTIAKKQELEWEKLF